MRIRKDLVVAGVIGIILGAFIASGMEFAKLVADRSLESYGSFMYGQGYGDGLTGENMAPDKARVKYRGEDHMTSSRQLW